MHKDIQANEDTHVIHVDNSQNICSTVQSLEFLAKSESDHTHRKDFHNDYVKP